MGISMDCLGVGEMQYMVGALQASRRRTMVRYCG